ncbi:hypothetical protein [Capnocytophaga canimorsus]|uniref:hypothetical protein n=1 Tax=Capnocytophaga canimorsus TaxID=28188 RepID=UPI0037D60A3C
MMYTIDSLREKLANYHLYDVAFEYFKQSDYHRDFEVFISDSGKINLCILLKGVVSVNYSSNINDKLFTMDDRYLKDAEPKPSEFFYWGIRSFILEDWEITDSSPDITTLQKDFDFKLFKLTFNINSCIISFIFNDLEIKVDNR